MKPTGAVIDVPLSTLDQAAPVTDKPIGRLSTLINAQVKLYQNPRFNVQDGSVAHVKVEKRDAFVTMSNVTKDSAGTPLTPPVGNPQILFGGGDALRMVVNNRLYTKTQSWIKDTDPTLAIEDKAVFPQILRSTPIYTADTTAEAPDMAVIGDVRCTVWRELSSSNASDCPPDLGGTAPPAPVPTALDGVRVQFSNSAGIIVPAFTLDPIGGAPQYLKARVVAFANTFWVFQDYIAAGASPYGVPKSVPIAYTLFTTDGVQAGSGVIATGTENESWDVTTMNTQGVVVAMPAGGTGVTFTAFTLPGGFLDIVTHTDTTIACKGVQCAWLTDDAQAANTGYLATVDDPGGPTGGLTASTIHAYRIVSLAQTLSYPAVAGPYDQTSASGSGTYISGISGYHVPGGNNLVVAFTLMDIDSDHEADLYGGTQPDALNTEAANKWPDQINNTLITVSVIAGGSSSVIATRYGMSLVTRAFAIGTDYVSIGYYPARIFGSLSTAGATSGNFPNRPVNPSNFQPTWYVIPLALVQPIAGRFEYGLASADYQIISFDFGLTNFFPESRNRCLTSPRVLPTGAIAMPLGYRAEQNIPSTTLVAGTLESGGNFQDFTSGAYSSGNTVGVKMFTIGPDCGRPFVVGQSTYFPGLMGAIVEPFDVTLTEQGLAAPECPRVLKSALANPLGATSSPAAAPGAHSYRAVFEWTTTTGRLYRSLPSAAFSFTIVESDHLAIASQVHNLFPTNKKNVKLSVYATGQVTSTKDGTAVATTPPTNQPATPVTSAETISSFKITNDLQPLYSDPTQKISTFNDYYITSQQAAGEQLYTDQGELPRFPAPAFRGGCVWLNRAWAIGYDNALWFTGEIAEGEGEYFNPGLRVFVPTNEEITAIAPMDSFLMIFCTNSIWYLPETSALPSNTGVGSIPTAIRLPFEMGGTGFTTVIRQGCLYSSSQGGVWMITRSLDNVWIGQNAKNDLDVLITGMCIAGNNVLVTDGIHILTYDTNLGAWGRWNPPVPSTVIAAFAGNALLSNNATVWVQSPGTFIDHDTINSVTYYAPTTATISPVHVGGIRSWKRTWEIQAQGQVVDFCDVIFTLAYGDYNANIKTYKNASLVPGPLAEAIRPTLQLASSVGMTITDAPNASTTTGAGFALEVMALYVGLEKGPNKLPPGARVKA